MKHLPPAALALALVSSSLLPGAPAGRRTWELSPFTWVRRVPAEKGAPLNGHPLQVEAAPLAQALGSVRFLSGRTEEPLFAPSEAGDLAKVLAEALALAEPGEDLELLSTSKRETGLFGMALSVTARVFARDGRLHLIVHDARRDAAYAYSLDLRMPTFQFGSRGAASAVVLKAAGAEARRADWLVLPLGAPAPPAVQPPAPQAAPPPVAPAPPRSLEERLRTLKRLREQNLITEEDYARRKQELLKEA